MTNDLRMTEAAICTVKAHAVSERICIPQPLLLSQQRNLASQRDAVHHSSVYCIRIREPESPDFILRPLLG